MLFYLIYVRLSFLIYPFKSFDKRKDKIWCLNKVIDDQNLIYFLLITAKYNKRKLEMVSSNIIYPELSLAFESSTNFAHRGEHFIKIIVEHGHPFGDFVFWKNFLFLVLFFCFLYFLFEFMTKFFEFSQSLFMLHDAVKDFSELCANFIVLVIKGFLLSLKVLFCSFHILGFDFVRFKHLFAVNFQGQQVIFSAFVVFIFILEFGKFRFRLFQKAKHINELSYLFVNLGFGLFALII